jgi:hypothetical protein
MGKKKLALSKETLRTLDEKELCRRRLKTDPLAATEN